VRRRDLLLAATAAVLARPATTFAAESEAGLLERLIALEQGAAFAYARAEITEPAGLARQEGEHAKALASQLAAMGLKAPAPPRRPAELGTQARRLASAARDGALAAAIGLEESLVAAYALAVPEFGQPQMLQTVATVMASHAQHLALLYAEAGRDPLP
jgi:hypothetical protein